MMPERRFIKKMFVVFGRRPMQSHGGLTVEIDKTPKKVSINLGNY